MQGASFASSGFVDVLKAPGTAVPLFPSGDGRLPFHFGGQLVARFGAGPVSAGTEWRTVQQFGTAMLMIFQECFVSAEIWFLLTETLLSS